MALVSDVDRAHAQRMTRHGYVIVVAMLCASTLTGCLDVSGPESPTPSSSPSASVTAEPSGSPSASPTSTPTSTPSPTESQPPTSDPIPQRVEGVTASAGGGSGEVLLRWTQNPEDDVVSYIVLRALTPGGALTRIGTVTWQQVTEFEYVPFVDSEATVGYYRVRAVDSAGQQGPKSAEVCGASFGHSC